MTAITAAGRGTESTVATDRVVGALGGLLFVVSSIVAGIVLPPPPDGDVAPARARAYFLDHRGGLRVAVVLTAIAVLGLAVFFAMARQRIAETDRGRGVADAFFAFGLLTVAAALAGTLAQALPIAQTRALGDDAVLVLFRLERTVFYTGPALTSTGWLLAGAAAARLGTFPRWTAALAVVAGVAGLLAGLLDLAGTSVSGALGFAGFLLTAAWVVVAALTMVRPAAEPAR